MPWAGALGTQRIKPGGRGDNQSHHPHPTHRPHSTSHPFQPAAPKMPEQQKHGGGGAGVWEALCLSGEGMRVGCTSEQLAQRAPPPRGGRGEPCCWDSPYPTPAPGPGAWGSHLSQRLLNRGPQNQQAGVDTNIPQTLKQHEGEPHGGDKDTPLSACRATC